MSFVTQLINSLCRNWRRLGREKLQPHSKPKHQQYHELDKQDHPKQLEDKIDGPDIAEKQQAHGADDRQQQQQAHKPEKSHQGQLPAPEKQKRPEEETEGASGEDWIPPLPTPAAKRTIDPLIAAQVYNRKHSSLLRLPEELLLHILHYIDDVVSLYCLRRVSGVLRRLIYERSLWKHNRALEPDTYTRFVTEFDSYMSAGMKRTLKHLLQSDGLCDPCKPWFGHSVEEGARTHAHSNTDWIRPHRARKKKWKTSRKLLCHACDHLHPERRFSYSNRDPDMQDRKCIAHQGAVQLCEHVHISWTAIAAHITDWKRHKPPRNWKACFDAFSVECHDPSHDMRCEGNRTPTWPRAYLSLCPGSFNIVVLALEWTPHSGFDALSCNTDGLVPAPEMRAMFKRYREGPASILFPSSPISPLPEMACFDPHVCSCLHYEVGEGGDASISTGQPMHPLPFRRLSARPCHPHMEHRCVYGETNQRVVVDLHFRNAHHDSFCLTAAYKTWIPVWSTVDSYNSGKPQPTKAWIRAMDPDTYPYDKDRDRGVPLCKDKCCMNYYRRQWLKWRQSSA